MTIVSGAAYNNEADNYPGLEQAIKEQFRFGVASKDVPLFTTDVENLFDIFLANIPANARQHYTCNACRAFVNRFGGLVTISENGNAVPVMWDLNLIPAFFRPAIDAVIGAIHRAKVTGVFLSSDRTWGVPQTGEWTHLHVVPSPGLVYKARLFTAGQKMAEYREDYKMVQTALSEYSLETIQQAVAIARSEALYRSEKVLGVAEWFGKLYINRNTTKDQRKRNNIVWLAVATAPAGFAHVRSSMIGTLLDDLQSGMSFDNVKRRFEEKMHPLKYQRPQAAPSAGNIAQAEKIVERLGIARSLERRFARLDEIETIWKPKVVDHAKHGGMFGHLKPKGISEPAKMTLPSKTMTWVKFENTVLPNARSIEINVPRHGSFTAMVTAQHEDSPPILQWDHVDCRNPFSWYVYNAGSYARQWGLSADWHKVSGITNQPSMWQEGYDQHGKSLIIIIEGAKDTNYQHSGGTGNALFPEILKSELREIRSTIEAYSRQESIGGYDLASACGIRLQYGQGWNVHLRVTTETGIAEYKLDRWD